MIEIKALGKNHIAQIAAIEKECFADPWSKESFEGELENPLARYFVAAEGDNVVGYGGIWAVAGEGNVTNIAVRKEYRNQTIGTKILDEMIRYAKENRFAFLTLEVRVSNDPAKKLYAKMGFQPVGIRKGYYQDNQEDALLMTLTFDREGGKT